MHEFGSTTAMALVVVVVVVVMAATPSTIDTNVFKAHVSIFINTHARVPII